MTTTAPRWVYAFEEGDGSNKMLLGGKGANLCEMTQIGLNVPPGFVITTEACLAYLETRAQLPDGPDGRRPRRTWRRSRRKTGKGFGGGDESAAGLGALGLGDVDAGHDGHHPQPRPQRDDAAGLDPPDRQRALRLRRLPPLHPAVRQDRAGRAGRAFRRSDGGDQAQASARAQDVDLDAEQLQELARALPRRSYSEHTGKPFPARSLRAARDRRSRRCSARGRASAPSTTAGSSGSRRTMANGTAVNVCTMVFGNMGNDSRAPASASRATRAPARTQIYGEYLVNAQGEDVVAGIRTPKPIADDGAGNAGALPAAGRAAQPAGDALPAKCRTSSSRSSAARSTACRRATAR